MPITPLTDLDQRGWMVQPQLTWDQKLPDGPDAVQLIPGVVGPEWMRAEGPFRTLPQSAGEAGGADLDVQVALEARFDRDRGCYLLRSLTVEAPDGSEVTGVLLREIAPLRIMRWVLPRTFQVEQDKLSVWVSAFIAPEVAAQATDPRPEAALEDAATVYRLAEVVREPPAKAVADALGLQTRTATNWIVRARKQGLLE
ncbi:MULTISPECIES: hypothetical protein [Arthrobacter]|uniref:Uncharacterized protein n=2 Tax=Arthrobacter TaxID=1663 RepID=A0ABU9KIX3_9MICC|nr:hypothetical protein [Arthrobacter sp. YJM1]MDP5226912.1 hypothetical protein [Arthrobacter sp. YJM1]